MKHRFLLLGVKFAYPARSKAHTQTNVRKFESLPFLGGHAPFPIYPRV
jgi:hypothetical protein